MHTEHMTECERVVMKSVWDAEHDVSLVEIIQILTEKYHKDWKRQTVSTFLLHLIQKGFLTSYRVGRVFYYHTEIPMEEYRKEITGDFIEFWFENDVRELKQMVLQYEKKD